MRSREWLLMSAAAAVLAWQLMIPGFIGMANNGDFARVAGRFCLQAAGSGSADNFIYFVPQYERSPQACWDAQSPGTAAWVAGLAGAGVTGTFDIRRLGAIYCVIFLVGFGALLAVLRPLGPWKQGILAATALLMFGDVRNAAYFNSFFTDTPALAGLCLLIPGAMLRSSGLMAAGALLFAASKGQHALAAWPFLVLFWLTNRRAANAVAAVAILAASIWVYRAPPRTYQGQAVFNVFFWRLLPRAAYPAETAAELGLRPEDLRFVGQHSFLTGSQALNPPWMDEFSVRVTHLNLLRYYARHPGVAFAFAREDLYEQATHLRPANLSNYQRRSGKPPGALDQRFALWTRTREAAQRCWPPILALLHLVLLTYAVWLARRADWTLLAVEIAALCEFLPASLGDCLETSRHLQVFTALTDWGIFVAVVSLAVYQFDGRRVRTARGQEGPYSPIESR
jgi:hypothetical protein